MHHIWRLHHFLSVAEQGSFHAAARAINVSQPALTKSIRLLEQDLGCSLFVRLPGGVRLTEAGELFRHRAREIEASWNASLVELKVQTRGLGGEMRIGGGPVYSAVYFPNMLADLRTNFPNLRVAVSTGVGADLLPLLQRGDLRCYAGGIPTEIDGLGRDFITDILYDQENSLFASSQHPLFDGGEITPEKLLDYPWLSLFSGGLANGKIDRFFASHELPAPPLALESHSLQIALKMLVEHNFIACMPVPLAQSYSTLQLREIHMEGFHWSIPTGITYHRSSKEFPPIKVMRKFLEKATPFAVAHRSDKKKASQAGP
ncbi:LysR family transcriptional regulator [Neorhizobium petrolearium]|uniref:LysR family transcriptional regulator n=1 Tax=Neorhizobium petrolearium TaxID=515361 RepID=UPI001AE4B4B5|nr:LysR family transcriptional regulator [Neorhizobium petrolearium]